MLLQTEIDRMDRAGALSAAGSAQPCLRRAEGRPMRLGRERIGAA